MSCGREGSRRSRGPERRAPAGLEILVAEYRREHHRHLVQERQFFERLPSLDLVIHHVALAVDEHGRCFDHQFRIRRSARREAERVLLESRNTIRKSRSFDDLHRQLEHLLLPIQGIGEMYIYDAAVRLGVNAD